MKKISMLMALLLVALLSLACAMPWGLPETKNFVAGQATREDGVVLLGENRWFSSRIYSLKDGTVAGIYEESRIRGEEESTIARVTSVKNGALFVRVFGNGRDWELVKLQNKKTKVLCKSSFEQDVTVTGLQVRGDSCFITAVGANKAIFVYEYTADGAVSLKMILPAWWLWGTVTAEYNGKTIRATTEYGDSCFLTSSGVCTYSPDAAELPLPILHPEAQAWLLCKKAVLTAALLLWLLIALVLFVATAISRRSEHLSNRVMAMGGAIVLLALLAAAGAVVCVVRVTGGLLASLEAGKWMLASSIVIWLLSLLLLRVAAAPMTRLIPELTKQMNRICDGDMSAREAVQGRDELCRMDQSLQMLCMNLSVWKYESVSTILSYRRFVPEKMAELLERPVAEEIQLGDSRRMIGNVGVFCVGNRAETRNSLEDDTFVVFVNHSFGIFHDCISENHGWMLSSGLRLSAMEALFPDSPADGVRAGLDFLGKIRVRKIEAIPEPRACLILHQASFLYGITGQEERLFPYLSSSELEFLSGYTQQLVEAGVRIVATEAYWKQLKDCGFTGRYIGFVSSGEHCGAYKLYEILDAYPELERNLRKAYDPRFQEAINLFYQNDFYLARNLFSALLRASPEDGIVRWYLFACERFFNQECGEDPDYSLFGVED